MGKWVYMFVGFALGIYPILVRLIQNKRDGEALSTTFTNIAWAEPIYFISGSIALIAPTMLYYMYKNHKLLKKNTSSILEKELTSEQIQKLWESKGFLSSFNDILPKGNKDSEYGIDYIPYMLKNVNERRKRYLKSSSIFLISTISTGFIFSAIIIFFGYILINETSAGFPKLLVNINKNIEKLEITSAKLLPTHLKSNEYIRGIGNSISILKKYSPTKKDDLDEYKEIISIIGRLNKISDYKKLEIKLIEAKISLSDKSNRDDKFIEIIKKTLSDLSVFLTNKNLIIPEISSLIKKLDDQISDISKANDLSESRQIELLKRLAIGIIISSFFLAILRYVASLYRENHRQMLKAEGDDLKIRQFYVAFKGLGNNDEGRKELMLDFFNSERPPINDITNSSTLSKEEASILKEIVSVLAKKI